MVQETKPEGRLGRVLKRLDGWANTVTGLGTSRDKRLGGAIKSTHGMSANEVFFEELFASDDMAAKIAEKPAKEMVREWIDFTVEAPEAEDGSRGPDTSDAKDVEMDMMKKLDKLKVKQRLRDGVTWSRVFGGSLVFLGVDDGTDPEDPNGLAEPLDPASVRSLDFLTVFDRHEVTIEKVEQDTASERFGLPATYRITPQGRGGQATAQNSRVIHASRFIRFDGVLTTRRRMRENAGWADSVYVRIDEILRDFGMAWGGIAHLLQDFSQAVYGLKDLNEVLAANQEDLVLKRLQLLDKCRAVSRAIPIDKEHESFDRMTTSLAGVDKTLVQFAIRLSAAANIPVVILMGMSPAGFQSTGESDLTMWYNEVRCMQEDVLREPINEIIELIFASGEIKEPKQWSYEFNPLWTLDEKEVSEVRRNNAQADVAYVDAGVLSEEEVAQSRFGGDKYGNDINLDNEKRETDEETDKLAARSMRTEPPQPVPPQPFPGQPGPPPQPPSEPGIAQN